MRFVAARRVLSGLAPAPLADVASVSITTVKNALRAARALGLISVEERRLSAFRNAPNIVRIVSPEWRAWLRLGANPCRAHLPVIKTNRRVQPNQSGPH